MIPWDIKISADDFEALMKHLFPGDHDEHGAVLAVGIAKGTRSNRLLVRHVFYAQDGVDYVAGQRGYRMLRAEFVRDCAYHCSDKHLAYLAVHNHGGTDHVGFSSDDMASHKRGYPGLLQLVRSPVGALVFATNAVAGDLWLPDGTRVEIRALEVVGPQRRLLYPAPKPYKFHPDATRDRQTLLLGPRGQEILAGLRVGIIGAGGVGSVIAAQLSRLGVGAVVMVDPERIEESNFSRLAGSRPLDFLPQLTRSRWKWLRDLGIRWSQRKVKIARRLFRATNRDGSFEALVADFREDAVARRFIDCDYLFLAADSMQARLLFNAIALQYMIPGAQVGAKASVDRTSGALTQVFSVVRRVLPDAGCLWCNGLIPASMLQSEAETEENRRRQRYVDDPDVHAPSVITMNSVAASLAVNQFLFSVTGLASTQRVHDYVLVDARTGETQEILCSA